MTYKYSTCISIKSVFLRKGNPPSFLSILNTYLHGTVVLISVLLMKNEKASIFFSIFTEQKPKIMHVFLIFKFLSEILIKSLAHITSSLYKTQTR